MMEIINGSLSYNLCSLYPLCENCKPRKNINISLNIILIFLRRRIYPIQDPNVAFIRSRILSPIQYANVIKKE